LKHFIRLALKKSKTRSIFFYLVYIYTKNWTIRFRQTFLKKLYRIEQALRQFIGSDENVFDVSTFFISSFHRLRQ
jgi:hypothetical protein